MGILTDITSKLWKSSKLPLKITSLALPILLGTSKIQAHEHTPEQIAKHATETTINEGYNYWKIDDVWYSNKPLVDREVLSKELSSQAAPDSYRVFSQPNDTDLVWYGSGAVDGKNADQSSLDSLLKIPTGARTDSVTMKHDWADVNIDGIITPEDSNIFSKFLNKIIDYFSSYWNKHKEENERTSCLEKMFAVDKVDTLHWVEGEFMCGDFSRQVYANFQGSAELKDSTIASKFTKYNLKENGRFNKPVYYVTIGAPTMAHAINACLVGNNPLNFYDWYFFEPQNDKRVLPGDWSMPKNSFDITIKYCIFQADGAVEERSLIRFKLNELVPEVTYVSPKLVLHRPVGIKPEFMPEVHKVASLGSNYPNPFNYSTNIEYSLEKPSQVMLNVYDLNGRKLETLVNQKQEAGKYNVNFDGKNLPSGIYFYELTAGGKKMVRKMVLMK